MCRLAAYVGPPVPLSTLLYDAPRSLQVQAYDPREQLSGAVNVDGTGIAWWPAGDAEPLRYVTERPPWSDVNLPTLAARLRSGAQLAAVRGATPGLGHGAGLTAPFVHEHVAGAHNGFIAEYRTRVARRLLQRLPDHLHARVEAASDSHALFLLAMAHLEADPHAALAGAAAAAVTEAAAVCADLGTPATLTLLLADGTTVVGTRTASGTAANTLYTLEDGARWPGATLLASEPLDDDLGWRPVPDGSVVQVSATEVRTTRVTRSPA
ncbi:MAG: hypothetical protein WD080_01720 [Egibacteraceae bacterium]